MNIIRKYPKTVIALALSFTAGFYIALLLIIRAFVS